MSSGPTYRFGKSNELSLSPSATSSLLHFTDGTVEHAKSGRAACQNSACKKEGPKIAKGELRMGTLVTINEKQSWQWKHWCVHFYI
jgi:hypothetical protein